MLYRKIIFSLTFIVSSILLGLLLGKYRPGLIVSIPSALIIISLLFFSRGVLIFLTTLCLILGGSRIAPLTALALQLRWVFFILFALHIFGDFFYGRSVRRIKSFDSLAIIFIIYAYLSTFYSPDTTLTLERATTVLLLYISVFWVIWRYAYTEGPEKVAYLLLKVAMLIFIVSYLMLFIGPYRPFWITRFTGIFGNPNSLGVICAIFLPLSLWEFLETKKKSALFLFFLILISLFLSGSRNSIIATIIVLGYFIYARSKNYRPLVFFVSMTFILILAWIMQSLAGQFFRVYFRIESIPTAAGRFEVWPLALDLISDKPIFGYGFGIEDKLLGLKGFVLHEHPGGYFHNSYLGMMLQLGILGFIIFFGPLFMLLFKELSLRQASQASLLRYALRASLMAGLICGIFESWLYSVGNTQTFPYWIMVMLLVFYRYQDKERGMV